MFPLNVMGILVEFNVTTDVSLWQNINYKHRMQRELNY